MHIIIEPFLCMVFGSREKIAQKIFLVEKNKMLIQKVKVVYEADKDFEIILVAAQTFPTKEIKMHIQTCW